MSDHNPLILCADFGEKKKQRQFCFETSWIKHPEYIKKNKEIWGKEVAAKNAVEKWQIKLNRVKKFLRGWCQNIKGHTKKIQKHSKRRTDVFGKRGGKREPTYPALGNENLYSNKIVANSRGRGIVLAQKI
jgi:hypothetical protein